MEHPTTSAVTPLFEGKDGEEAIEEASHHGGRITVQISHNLDPTMIGLSPLSLSNIYQRTNSRSMWSVNSSLSLAVS